MSLMNSIQQYPMQFMMPQFPGALQGNPEMLKAAQYGGGGGGGALPAQGAPAVGGVPAPGGAPAGGGGMGAGSIIDKIMKMLSGGGGSIDPAMIMSLMG